MIDISLADNHWAVLVIDQEELKDIMDYADAIIKRSAVDPAYKLPQWPPDKMNLLKSAILAYELAAIEALHQDGFYAPTCKAAAYQAAVLKFVASGGSKILNPKKKWANYHE